MIKTQSQLKDIPVEWLRRGKYQPRRDFNQDALQELADSIAEQGIIEPIIVRPLAEKRYEIIAGERRWRAAQLAGLGVVPCVIRDYSDEEAAEVTLIENIQREDLNPIEEAQALHRLLDEFHYTHEEIATAIGKSRAKITNILRLLHLDERVQRLLIERVLSEGHGKALAGLPFAAQFPLAQKAVEQAWSVRKMEQAVKQEKNTGSVAENTEDANIKHLERAASDRLGSEVKVENSASQRSGWLKVKYYDYETLAGILEKMGINIE